MRPADPFASVTDKLIVQKAIEPQEAHQVGNQIQDLDEDVEDDPERVVALRVGAFVEVVLCDRFGVWVVAFHCVL